VVTIEVSGCNREVIRLGAKKVLRGENFEKLNEELAKYADILVVIEGDKKSGTILVAKCFLDLGKEIWVVPGRITEENSWMTNYLLKNGATPLTELADLTGSLQ
jgi:DNA processing protein